MRRSRWAAILVTSAVVLAACGGSWGGGEAFDPLTDDPNEADAPAAPEREEVAGTDLTTHAVPLADVVFDTFDGGSVPLSAASEEQVLSLRDAIVPISEPRYVAASSVADVLEPDEPVLGYVASGDAYAYPHRILFVHEIVNDTLGGEPVLVSYCPLCNSGVVFDRRLPDGTELTFGNTSALYENDLVMYDHQTFSYWWQVPGRAIVGELSGTELEALPSTTTTWEEWAELHPDTQVLSLDQGFGIDYRPRSTDDIAAGVDAGQPPFPVDADVLDDDRLPSSAQVVGVEVGGDARAFPVTGEPDAAHDTVGGTPVVVLLQPDGGAAFRARAPDGEPLTFAVAPDGRGWTDEETGTRWDAAGRGVHGPLGGEQLEPLPSRSTFWFAYLASFPDVTVWSP